MLFSQAARPYLEQMARRAQAVTRTRFGHTITLYAPLYLSNHCVNGCSYCGFAAHRSMSRRKLSLAEAASQAEILMEQGIRHLLLVTGEAPDLYGLDAICEVVSSIRRRAASVAVEIFPCDGEGYQRLVAAGVDGLVLYQETYDPAIYSALHPRGPKRNFGARLMAMDAGGAAGFRSLGIGSLLGLAPPLTECVYLAWHGDHLSRAFPLSRLAVSFPRLRPVPGGTPVLHPISDAILAQAIVGMRLLFPDADLVLSTREPAALRDHLIHLGITRMSAGSRTSPGGYGRNWPDDEAGQFCTEDRRGVAQVAESIRAAGLDVVTKDFDPVFMESTDEI